MHLAINAFEVEVGCCITNGQGFESFRTLGRRLGGQDQAEEGKEGEKRIFHTRFMAESR